MGHEWKCEECKAVGSWLGALCNRCLHREHRDRWMLLPAPTQAEIDDALAWIDATHDPDQVVTGFFVSGPDGTDQGEEFCREHADALAAELGEGSYVGNASGGETDGERWCGHGDCGKQLDVGSFTDEGERSVLGLTEDDLMRILQEPKNALIKQYQKMFELENVELKFTTNALKAVAAGVAVVRIPPRFASRLGGKSG